MNKQVGEWLRSPRKAAGPSLGWPSNVHNQPGTKGHRPKACDDWPMAQVACKYYCWWSMALDIYLLQNVICPCYSEAKKKQNKTTTNHKTGWTKNKQLEWDLKFYSKCRLNTVQMNKIPTNSHSWHSIATSWMSKETYKGLMSLFSTYSCCE